MSLAEKEEEVKKGEEEKKEEKKVLKWDGSHLGSISKKDLKVENGIHSFVIDSLTVSGIAKKVKNTLPAIIDELKPYFQIPKAGTHLFNINSTLYIIYRYVEGDISLVDFVKEHKISVFLRNQIQNIFSFREMLGIKSNSNKFIIIRREKGKNMKAISTFETSSRLEIESTTLAQRVVNEWFIEKTIPETICQLLDYSEDVNKVVFMKNLRENIDRVVVRVDKNNVWITSFILDRIDNCIKRLKQ